MLGLLIVLAAGCTTPYALYQQPIAQLEQGRSFDGAVGIVVSPYPGEVEDVRPARGRWGGFKRGFVVGAAAPIAIGFVSPIPGGTLMGTVLAPVTGLIGGVMGIFDALPAETVDAVELVLESAGQRLTEMHLVQDLALEIRAQGERATGKRFAQLSWPDSDAPPRELSAENATHYDGVGALLEIVIVRVGLTGEYRIDPPASVFAEVRARLMNTGDGSVLLESKLGCHSEPRRFAEWGERNGDVMIDAFVACVAPLAEKIVDDLFLVWPDRGDKP